MERGDWLSKNRSCLASVKEPNFPVTLGLRWSIPNDYEERLLLDHDLKLEVHLLEDLYM